MLQTRVLRSIIIVRRSGFGKIQQTLAALLIVNGGLRVTTELLFLRQSYKEPPSKATFYGHPVLPLLPAAFAAITGYYARVPELDAAAQLEYHDLDRSTDQSQLLDL